VYEIQNINIKLNLGEQCYTSGYSNELNQVIINILNNARDQILETSSQIRDISIVTTTKNDKVILEINDYAGGIPLDIIDRIFEPYVTTKDDDHGTGIGLDMSKTIIEKVGGKIEARNETYLIDGVNYTGAVFSITLKSCRESCLEK
jgi:signal transduction histidine kinase